MKTWFIALPLVFAANAALAADQTEPAASQSQQKMTAQEKARMHQRDMRHCLDKKTNREIHRCTVKKNKRK